MSERSLTDEMLRERFADLREKVNNAARGREITVVAATKTVDAETINYATHTLGLRDIGENRVQELLAKYQGLDSEHLNIHFIGRLQTNKVKYMIDKVCLIHSVDSEGLAREIDKQAGKHSLKMRVLIELNVASESSKGGIAPEDAHILAETISTLENVSLVGVMAIPPKNCEKERLKKLFATARETLDALTASGYIDTDRPILSMGMSDDYECAIECGANMIRPGRALFGERKVQK